MRFTSLIAFTGIMSAISATNVYFSEDVNSWVVENLEISGQTYVFSDQDAVQDFADAMSSGDSGEVMDIVASAFLHSPDPALLYEELFEEASVLDYQSSEIFAVLEEESTLDVFLLEAGEALVEALIIFKEAAAGLNAKSINLPLKPSRHFRLAANGERGTTNNETLEERVFPRAASGPEYSITWSNFAKVNFGLSFINDANPKIIPSKKPIAEPNGVHYLKGNHEQTLSWYRLGSAFTQGSVTITHPSGSQFAVQIQQMDGWPYFKVGQSDGSAGWAWVGEFRGEGYTFPRLPGDIGEMVVHATVGPSSLALNVGITAPEHP